MNIDAQLSLIGTDNDKRGLNVEHSTPAELQNSESQASSVTGQPYGEVSYADLKGRVSSPQVAQTANPQRPKAASKQRKAWSQNLGHENMATTDQYYGKLLSYSN